MKLFMYKEKSELEKVSLDDNYHWRFFEEGDEKLWAEIVYRTKEFETKEAAIFRFHNEFGGKIEEVSKACIFLEHKDGECVGTIMAWKGQVSEQEMGRIHWLSIVPEHQGKGLSKFLLNKATELLFESYDFIYLSTQINSKRAINLYLNHQFKPLITNCEEGIVWNKILKEYEKYQKTRRSQP